MIGEKFLGRVWLPPAVFTFIAIVFFLGSRASSASAAARITDEQREFASFIDGYLAGVQRERSIPGMAFAAVRNGEILYLKGYGVADAASETPVTPDGTMFRVGPISRLATGIAMMQLVERGRVSLDEDVNAYLRRWKLPEAFGAPVTIRLMMTQTAGFDCKKLEVRAPTSEDERSYGVRLHKTMPARSAAPGRFHCRSDMSYALIGAIIERYSRQDFAPAIKRHVFQPLGMGSSTFSPAPDELRRIAVGYSAAGRPLPYEYRYDMPAMSMSTTASDMARFMTAMLAGGVIGGNRVLGDMYAKSMMRRHFSPHPMIDGVGLGYLEKRVLGWRTLRQTGNMDGYSGFLMLLPEKGLGVFFAANVSGLDFYDEMASAIVRRFFPFPGGGKEDKKPAEGSPGPALTRDVAGNYRTNLISRRTAEKSARMFADQVEVSVDGGSLLLEHTVEKIPPTRWVPSSPDIRAGAAFSGDLFQRVDDNANLEPEYLFFQRDGEGRVEAMVMGSVSRTYDRLKTHEGRRWQVGLIILFALTALVSFSGCIVGNEINRWKLLWDKDLRSDTELWNISSIFCLAQISFVIGLAASIYFKGHEFSVFVPYQVKALFVVPLGGTLLLAWLWFRIAANVLNPEHHWAEKLLIAAVACVETGYLFFLADWRLLGFMF
ncbi:MAG: beta-lactamase family protein [Synergistaceae bacterium]|jgi:CubicO group peptidase (beta-lactamase class C family)|nr:beta-lactamase family protein [Synergistaceae bacterium]